jgi:hypothetical protein
MSCTQCIILKNKWFLTNFLKQPFFLKYVWYLRYRTCTVPTHNLSWSDPELAVKITDPDPQYCLFSSAKRRSKMLMCMYNTAKILANKLLYLAKLPCRRERGLKDWVIYWFVYHNGCITEPTLSLRVLTSVCCYPLLLRTVLVTRDALLSANPKLASGSLRPAEWRRDRRCCTPARTHTQLRWVVVAV